MKTIPLACGEVVLVDDEDYERLSKSEWIYVKGNGHVSRQGNGKPISHEILQTDKIVDHIDMNGLNNLVWQPQKCQ